MLSRNTSAYQQHSHAFGIYVMILYSKSKGLCIILMFFDEQEGLRPY
jgi:hypothetical protein